MECDVQPERRRLVIVGHGMVGHRLVQTLVDRGALDAWSIVVLAEEPRLAYDRVGLSALFDGSTANDLALASPELFEIDGLDVVLADPVASIDRDAKTVTTASGSVHAYDALVLATGS